MKIKYYLYMFSSIIVVGMYDFIYMASLSQGEFQKFGLVDKIENISHLEMYLRTFGLESIFFLVINFIGCYFIFKPIDKYLKNKILLKKAENRIRYLPIISTLWIALISLAYITIVFFLITDSTSETLFIILGLLYGYPILIGFYTLLAINYFVMNLKEYIFNKFNVILFMQNTKIWKKQFIIQIILSFLPVIYNMYYFLKIGISNNPISTTNNFIITGFLGNTIGIIMSIYFIMKNFKKPLEYLIESIYEVREGNYNKRTAVISDDEIGILTNNFNGMVEGLKEREIIRDTFGKYVSKSVADEILHHRVNLDGDVKLATILFTDIENYTSISEGLPPTEIVFLLNDYFTSIVEIITKYKGIVNKFIGDGIFALFNVPVDDEEHAKNAVLSAIEIQKLSLSRKFGNAIDLNTRIGINTGIIVVGNIGCKDRLEYTAIGDEVNIASRLEQLNKAYNSKILVGEETYLLTKDYFNYEHIQETILKGKKSKVQVYKVNF